MCSEPALHATMTVSGRRSVPTYQVALEWCEKLLDRDVWAVLQGACIGHMPKYLPNKAAIDTLNRADRVATGLTPINWADPVVYAAAVFCHMPPGYAKRLRDLLALWKQPDEAVTE